MGQPTVIRHLRQLEQSLGTRVFERTPDGHRLTKWGQHLLPMAQSMADAATAIERRRLAFGDDPGGVVRVAAGEWVARFLAPHLAHLASAHRDLTVELDESHVEPDLDRREADLFIRPGLPARGHLIRVALGTIAAAIYDAPRRGAAGDADRRPLALVPLGGLGRAARVLPDDGLVDGASRRSAAAGARVTVLVAGRGDPGGGRPRRPALLRRRRRPGARAAHATHRGTRRRLLAARPSRPQDRPPRAAPERSDSCGLQGKSTDTPGTARGRSSWRPRGNVLASAAIVRHCGVGKENGVDETTARPVGGAGVSLAAGVAGGRC